GPRAGSLRASYRSGVRDERLESALRRRGSDARVDQKQVVERVELLRERCSGATVVEDGERPHAPVVPPLGEGARHRERNGVLAGDLQVPKDAPVHERKKQVARALLRAGDTRLTGEARPHLQRELVT